VPNECLPPINWRILVDKVRNDKFVNIKSIEHTEDPTVDLTKTRIYNSLLKEVYTFNVDENPLVKKNAKNYKFH